MDAPRTSKKQRELLEYIDDFIKNNGYGPSYREIMRALGYKSVSTVAVHVDGLIACGLIRKTEKSARSIEVLAQPSGTSDHITWLKREVLLREESSLPGHEKEAEVLRRALAILDKR